MQLHPFFSHTLLWFYVALKIHCSALCHACGWNRHILLSLRLCFYDKLMPYQWICTSLIAVVVNMSEFTCFMLLLKLFFLKSSTVFPPSCCHFTVFCFNCWLAILLCWDVYFLYDVQVPYQCICTDSCCQKWICVFSLDTELFLLEMMSHVTNI